MKREQEERHYPSLFLDYRDEADGIKELYLSHYKHFDDIEDKYSWLTDNFPEENRQALVQDLIKYNISLEASAETLENIEKLKDPQTVVVATGQQAGIFTGPLYTVYKAITAVKLVERLNEKGLSTVPVFWIASEDHDFREVNHIHLQGLDGGVEEITLPGGENGYLPVEYLPIEFTRFLQLIVQLEEHISPTEFRDSVLMLLQNSARKSDSLTRWFGRLMAWLFAKQGLILFNPLLKGIRDRTGSLLSSFCVHRGKVADVLDKQEKIIQALGYHLQVKREGSQINLFGLREKGRVALFEKNGRVVTRQGADLGTVQETTESIIKHPEKYSPNVITRPLLQEMLLPTVMQVCGPGEISYFGQLMPLYSLFKLKPPVLYPRPSVTLIEPRMVRYLKKYSLTEKELFNINKARLSYLEEKEEISISGLFESLEKTVEREYETIKEQLKHINSQLGSLTDTNRNIVLKDIAYLRGKAQEELKEKHEVALGHFYKLENACYPVNELQERIYNIFPYIIKYGPAFWDKLVKEFPLKEGHHFYRLT
ncbi:bacillithiol biosynthesis cysteine-adding enzyme BshC [Candidatus Contubernalis alkaliaceticus]|uniref:bacillithiol biosynthesis cysteine-adding enzyme BshC n=1 Tax=Candidatus Contubernalis alkaliaceticus TaxID=338645 RepID=UPI001F4BD9F4|nr:bacillithiol biosynthesis cysteine-adding enzyme BshC [Candidatus Contubernalis alkalaceticus]UNC92459.1 bacillithiol biosynthesis cysteine-adding enzyme BshC [Candidatus Contubernalis alkalaceticus]